MTTEIEKKFFDTFGIEPKEKVNQTFNGADFKVETTKEYPQITGCILLELIGILNTVTIPTIPDLGDIKIDRLRKTILEECIVVLDVINTPTKEEFINDIRTLFEGGSR